MPPPSLPIVYDKLDIVEYSTAVGLGPLTIGDQKGLLGWETEKEFQARKVKEIPDTKPEAWLFGDMYHCKNIAGEKVRCNHNGQNRPFDMDWCEHLIHTILHGQWAGPFTIPGETVNGETVRISRYGRVMSGQHQMTACILAGELLARARELGVDHPDKPKYPTWRTLGEPFLETIVITGISEDPRVLMTVDYNKPRTVADVFYTSKLFRNSTTSERQNLCRILAVAVNTLWVRTDARGYRTHPEAVAFLERHRTLLKCVEHVNKEDNPKQTRKLSNLRLQPGMCAAVMYIQASSGPGTDGDVYRNEDPAPSEKNLDWSMWDRAKDFWALLASGKEFLPVRKALWGLIDSTPQNEDNPGLGGRVPEKLAILSKAWSRWKDYPDSGTPFDDDDLVPGGLLCLNYNNLDAKGNKLPEGKIELVDVPDFVGIDCPEATGKGKTSHGPPDPPPPTKEEIEQMMEEAQQRRRAESRK
jgi:hypothetical protein